MGLRARRQAAAGCPWIDSRAPTQSPASARQAGRGCRASVDIIHARPYAMDGSAGMTVRLAKLPAKASEGNAPWDSSK